MALDATEEELVKLAAATLLNLVTTAGTAGAAAIVTVIDLAYDFVEQAAAGNWAGAIAVIYNTMLGPFAIFVAYTVMRGQLTEVARMMERQAVLPFEQTTWMQRQVLIYDTDRQERVCVGGPYNPKTGMAGSCTLQKSPGWVRRMATIGIRGPLAGRAVGGHVFEKVRIFAGIRANIYRARFVDWRPLPRSW